MGNNTSTDDIIPEYVHTCSVDTGGVCGNYPYTCVRAERRLRRYTDEDDATDQDVAPA
jgi:hypothetical protein